MDKIVEQTELKQGSFYIVETTASKIMQFDKKCNLINFGHPTYLRCLKKDEDGKETLLALIPHVFVKCVVFIDE